MRTARYGWWVMLPIGWCLVAWWPAVVVGQSFSGSSAAGQAGASPAERYAVPPAGRPGAYSTAPASGFQQPGQQPSGPMGQTVYGPDQPVVPHDPQLVHRQQPGYAGQPPQQGQQVPYVPFTLTPQQQAVVDWVLQRWEQRGSQIKTYECRFTRFEYDSVFGDGKTPLFVDQGEIKYIAPDKGLFRVLPSEGKGQTREEQWICNGESIFQFDYQKKQLIEHKLPPDLRGQAISEGPLPFVFGAKADTLKRRYYVRIVTPPNAEGQIWLEAWPRWQADAANFQRATVILTADEMLPFAIELVAPNGKSRTVYRLQDPKVNARNLLDPLNLFKQSWLNPRTPVGWKKIVEEPPPRQTAGYSRQQPR